MSELEGPMSLPLGWGSQPRKPVLQWDKQDCLQFLLFWAEIWNHQAGGYLASNTLSGLLQCVKVANQGK
ncbi:MAG: hypothetical protein GY937_20100 [bacterium]|nr:hypothetical protein [bacterium]